MLEQHGKAILTFFGAAGGTFIAWLPTIDVIVRVGSGIMAMIAAAYTALYFRKQWKGVK